MSFFSNGIVWIFRYLTMNFQSVSFYFQETNGFIFSILNENGFFVHGLEFTTVLILTVMPSSFLVHLDCNLICRIHPKHICMVLLGILQELRTKTGSLIFFGNFQSLNYMMIIFLFDI